MDKFESIQARLQTFGSERDWDQFHSPKNLAMALIVEAAELVEHFQWLTEEQSVSLSPEKLSEVELELADIQMYLIKLADKLGIDLFEAIEKKMVINAEKYPVEKVKGSAKKYNEYE